MSRPVELMTLGNMRANGVRTIATWCSERDCNHHGVVDVERFGDDVPVPSLGRGCGAKPADTWARTLGRTGKSARRPACSEHAQTTPNQ